MRRVLADLGAFARQYFRSPIGAFFAFVFPILLILLFGAFFSGGGSQAISLPVQDLDGSAMSGTFVGLLNETRVVSVTMIPPTADIQAYIKDNSLTLALRIPADFATNASQRLPVNVTLYGDPSQSTFGMVQGVVGAVLEHMNNEINQVVPVVGMNVRSVGAQGFVFMDFFLPGIVGMTVMINTLYMITSLSAEYRTRRYFKLLATTTLTKAEWLASKILFYSILGIASLLVTVAVGYAVWHMSFTINALALAFVVAGSVLFTSLGMLIGSIVKDPESGAAVSNILGFPMMFLSGTFFQLEAMPGYIQLIAKALPLTYLNNGLRDAMVYGNLDGALFNFGVVGGLAVVLFILAAKLVSWKER